MSHYKKIRRSLRGLSIAPITRSWLYKLRREEMDLERRLAGQIKKAKLEGRCSALIMPTRGSNTPYRTTEPTPGRLCGKPRERRGYCMGHFITHYLHLPERKSGHAGRGVSVRPFPAYQFPTGRLSPKQEDLMNDLQRLPMSTSREECLALVNAEDPDNALTLPKRTSLSKRRRR
jgi:hypothetical protein